MRYGTTALFLLMASIFGTAFVAIKVGLAYFPPVLFAALRYDVAALLVLGSVAIASDYWRPRNPADWMVVLAGGALTIGSYNAFLFLGERTVTSGVAAILVSLSPLLTTVLSRGLLPDERLAPTGLVGLLVGLVGVGLVVRPSPGGADPVGSGLVLVAATAVALGTVLIQRAGGSLPHRSRLGWSCLLGAGFLHASNALLFPEASFESIQWTTEAVIALGYLAVIASGIGYLLYFVLLERLGSIELSLVTYVVPVVTTLVGWFVLGETLDPVTGIGFLAIFGGFLLIKREAVAERLAGQPFPL